MTTGGRPGHVVVVGGGVAGLTAAFRLTQAGTDVTVVEPGRLGGKLQTSVFAGRPLDETADNFLLRVPWALALCHDLDLDGELISPLARRAEIFVDGVRHAMPEGHLLGVPADLASLRASGLLSEAGLARVEQDLELPRQPTDPVAGDPATHPAADVAIGPYLRGRLGDEVVDHLIDPLVGGINAGDTNRLSLAAVAPQIHAAAQSGDPSLIRSAAAQLASAGTSDAPVFATPVGGMARIVDGLLALMPAAELLVGRSVVALEPAPTGRPGWVVSLDDGSVLDADAVVVACPAFAAGPLLADVAPTAADHLGSLDHSSISMVAFAFDTAALGGGAGAPAGLSGCLVPRDQGMLVSAISYGTSKWPQWRSPDLDDTILRVSSGRVGDDRHLSLDDDSLVAGMLDDIDRIVGVGGPPTEVRVGRWPRSFPQYAPGHLARVSEIESELAAVSRRRGGLVLAGAALRGVGVPACIRSGEEAATTLGAAWPTRRARLSP